jgi:pimeloyl-ACP methyl ester carboxylesterase
VRRPLGATTLGWTRAGHATHPTQRQEGIDVQTRSINGLFLRLSSWPLERKPTLVLLHGSGNTGALWDAQVVGLADVANVVAVDLAGHGQSEGPLADSVREHAASIARLIPALGVSRVVVGGLSLGGGIALQMLLDHADVLDGGVLVGTGARLRVAPMILHTIEHDYPAFVEGLPRAAASSKTDPALLQPLLRAALDNGAEVTRADFLACDAFDVMDRLGEIDRPVLVVSGEHDQLTPPKYSSYLAEQVRDAKLVAVPDAGHLSPVERPVAVNQAIREWLAELAWEPDR